MAETSKTVENALRVLASFSALHPVRTAADLSREMHVSKTSILRLLASLENFRLITKDERGRGYRIGLKAFEIGALYMAAHPQRVTWSAALDELVERTMCTAYLAKLDRDDVVLLGCKQGTLPIRFVWEAGARLPCTTTALGKAIIMNMTPSELDKLLDKEQPLRGLTNRSLRNREELDLELVGARARGWALARDESHAGLTAIGAAILGAADQPVAAISISLLDQPPNPERLQDLAQIVTEVARRLSELNSTYDAYDHASAHISAAS